MAPRPILRTYNNIINNKMQRLIQPKSKRNKRKAKAYKAVGENKFTYNENTDTYESAYSLPSVTATGKDMRIAKNVRTARDKFAMNYVYPAAAVAGAGVAAKKLAPYAMKRASNFVKGFKDMDIDNKIVTPVVGAAMAITPDSETREFLSKGAANRSSRIKEYLNSIGYDESRLQKEQLGYRYGGKNGAVKFKKLIQPFLDDIDTELKEVYSPWWKSAAESYLNPPARKRANKTKRVSMKNRYKSNK